MKEIKTMGVTILTLFLSLGTLICCVLPVIFVSLGLGVVVAATLSSVPFLVTLSQYKVLIFCGISFVVSLYSMAALAIISELSS